MMRVALCHVTAEELVKVLKLPPGTRIIDMRSTSFTRVPGELGPSLEVIVEAEGLADLHEGLAIPIIQPRYEERFHSTKHFVEWR